MNIIDKLIRACRDGEQADELTSNRDELERARRAYEELSEHDNESDI